MRPINRTGQKFGRLTLVNRLASSKYECLCDCGKTTIVRDGNLTSGNTQSCGCFHSERTAQSNFTHGKSKASEYGIWSQMKARCEKAGSAAYRHYGGRGIKVCERWSMKGGFENFYADMGPRPQGLCIERIDNDGDYCPENCKWATRKEEADNRRSSVIIEYDGLKMSIMKWSEKLGIPFKTLHSRLRVMKWDIERAFTQPVRDCGRFKRMWLNHQPGVK